MIWDPRFDALDPTLCLACEEMEVLKDTDLCLDCTLDDEMAQAEDEFWRRWTEDVQAEDGQALIDALAAKGVY